ncbi:MAG: PQQ-dependent sugar dehydrogenase [Granulosicoccus sp.]|nr:PQQ-dependent sugar dehydrogenase [Granulosicoccus sp.]
MKNLLSQFVDSGCKFTTKTHNLSQGLLLGLCVLAACAADSVPADEFVVASTAGAERQVQVLAQFDSPWAMCFLPSGRALVSEKSGKLWLLTSERSTTANGKILDQLESATADTLRRFEINGLPLIRASGQGGLGDVIIHPQFASNSLVYLSYVERDDSGSGAVVARAKLNLLEPDKPALEQWQIIWRQLPRVDGEGHYAYRLAFSEDGYLFITSGERQQFDPAQDMQQNLGKILRLHDDGSIPKDNPFVGQGEIAEQVWSLGHRNPLGIAFDGDGKLWSHEMGPRGGDELNEIVAAANYGYPLVSNGRHYSGLPIPDHDTRPDLKAPVISWTPVISPSGLIVYSGDRYKSWNGSALIGGLSSRSLVRVALVENPQELERFDMGERIREVEQGPSGMVYLLEDKSSGRLLRLLPDS